MIKSRPAAAHHTYFLNVCGVLRSHLMTVGPSAPDAALVHGFRGREEDGGEADNPETDRNSHADTVVWCSIQTQISQQANFTFIMCN